jgi:DNA repair protein RecN (Recombination protein N)
MRIQNLGVINEAALEFSSGFTVVTGETGAGKTMVVTGLGLLFGGRADSGRVRTGADRAVVEGRLVVPVGGSSAQRVTEAGGELDPIDVGIGELIMSRSVSTEGRSRAHVGGRSVPVSLLSELGVEQLAIHGQSDQQRLLQPGRQRAVVDEAAGAPVTQLLTRFAGTHQRWREVNAELEMLLEQSRDRVQEAETLAVGLREIQAINPQLGEDESLAAEALRLGHAEELKTAAGVAREALVGDPAGRDVMDAVNQLAVARRSLEGMALQDPLLGSLAERVAELGYLMADVVADIATYIEGIDVDPLRLAAVHDRRSALIGLNRKYSGTSPHAVASVMEWAESAEHRLNELGAADDRVPELTTERDCLREELTAAAAELSVARRVAAAELSSVITAELHDLAMPHAHVAINIRQHDDPDGVFFEGRKVACGAFGIDEVEITLAAHSGADPRPLGKGASGGELSRVMLALEVVLVSRSLGQHSPGAASGPTLVFDEVDAGVGGRAAVEVGRRLARLARGAQVIVVTHLPQVAAFADRHLVVEKSTDGQVTKAGVRVVREADRIRELSRMLAGVDDSASARAHAEELLAAARVDHSDKPLTWQDTLT